MGRASNLLDKIKSLNEKLSKKELANEIADLASKVVKKDKKKFDDLIKKSTKSVDPSGKMKMKDAILKLSDKDASQLFQDLLDFEFKE